MEKEKTNERAAMYERKEDEERRRDGRDGDEGQLRVGYQRYISLVDVYQSRA